MTRAVVESSMRCLLLTAMTLQALALWLGAEPESQTVRFYNVAQDLKRLALAENMTLLQAIALGGGKTESAIQRVAVFREGQHTTYHDVKDLRVNPSEDMKLKANDKVVVCTDMIEVSCGIRQFERGSVVGEVKTLDRILFVEEMTLLDAIAAVGGITNWARMDVILIRNKNRHTYDLKELMLDPTKDVMLQPNDKIIAVHR